MATIEEVKVMTAISEFKRTVKLPKGSKIYVIIRSVAPSGMSRTMDFYVIAGKGKDRYMRYLTSYFVKVLRWSRAKNDAMIVKGTGMDMCFHAVRSFAQAVYKDAEYLRHETL